MLNAVIIDDEKKARHFVKYLIENYFPDIKILELASSVIEGIKAITRNKPDIVFLDIEMQDGSGFDVLEAIPERNFEFIFITAFDHYALKAFKYSAIDYIVKPIDIDEFGSAIDRIKNRLGLSQNIQDNYDILKTNLHNKSPSKLVIPSIKGYEYIETCNIIRFEADGRYTKIHLTDNRIITVTKMLREFIDLVDDNIFYRTHKSHIINMKYVKMYLKAEGGSILMIDDSKVSITKNNREEFLSLMLT